MVGDLRMWLYRANPGNPRQMRRRRPISSANRTPQPARLRLHPVYSGPQPSVCGCAAAVVDLQPETALPTELPEHECSGRDSNPRPVGVKSITGSVPARSRSFVAIVMRGRTAVSKPRGLGPSYHEITEPLRPATNRLARIRTRTSEVGARCASSYTTGLDKAGDPDRTGSSGLAEAGGHAAEPRGL